MPTDTEAQMLTLSADMDESSSLLDLLECSVCLERLDTTAKVLPCQHTFCRRCLENIVTSRNELRCPECRILVDCGVDDLPANILLVRLLDGIKQRPQRGSGGGGGAGGRQSLAGGSLQGYAAGICASPPGSAIRELPVATRSSPVKVGYSPNAAMYNVIMPQSQNNIATTSSSVPSVEQHILVEGVTQTYSTVFIWDVCRRPLVPLDACTDAVLLYEYSSHR